MAYGRGRKMGKIRFREKGWWIVFLILLICAIAVLGAALLIFRHFQENYVRYSADQITSQIISELGYTDLTKIDQSQLSKHYDIPEGTVVQSSVYMSKSSESASELACFLLVNKSKFETLKASVNTHMSAKAAGFKSLNPTQYDEVKDFLLSQNGRYVLVAVGSNTEAEEKLFRSMTG